METSIVKFGNGEVQGYHGDTSPIEPESQSEVPVEPTMSVPPYSVTYSEPEVRSRSKLKAETVSVGTLKPFHD